MSRPYVPVNLKLAVIERAKGCCEYCLSQAKFSPDTLSVEHITPYARGGTNDFDNLAASCQCCNNLKYILVEAIDPLTGELAPLFHPRRDRWNDHFGWNKDYTLMVGRTATGRATIEKMDLNREGVVNLRRLLAGGKLHPPKMQEPDEEKR
ncbi:MAG: HNH endonuclease [Acidobacteriota bacterium]